MKVIRRLRNKMVVTVLTIQSIVFALVLISLNIAVLFFVLQETRSALYHFTAHDIPILEKRHDWVQSRIKDFPLPEEKHSMEIDKNYYKKQNPWRDFFSFLMPSSRQSRSKTFFGITYDIEGNLASVLSYFPPRYTEAELNSLVTQGLNLEFTDKSRFHFSSTGAFLYIKKTTPRGSLVALADFTREFQTAGHLLLISGGVFLISIVISALVAWFLAKRSVLPVQQAFETQKQFIADAGHELKTPVSVIAANVDALSGEIGENKWVDYIKSEIKLMARLINDLLYLAKNDAGRLPLVYSSFDLSRTVEAAVLPFESIIFEQEKYLELEIQEGIRWVGDADGISQAVVILLDNAIKNSSPEARIRVSLEMVSNRRAQGRFGKNHTHPVITVYNQGEGLSQKEMNQVFKRFYRSDSSRARETGGCGLGLSIAQAIAQNHQGSISVAGKEGEWISFGLHLGCLSKGIAPKEV